MDLRIGGAYEQALLKLAEYNQEPTATGMVRIRMPYQPTSNSAIY